MKYALSIFLLVGAPSVALGADVGAHKKQKHILELCQIDPAHFSDNSEHQLIVGCITNQPQLVATAFERGAPITSLNKRIGIFADDNDNLLEQVCWWAGKQVWAIIVGHHAFSEFKDINLLVNAIHRTNVGLVSLLMKQKGYKVSNDVYVDALIATEDIVESSKHSICFSDLMKTKRQLFRNQDFKKKYYSKVGQSNVSDDEDDQLSEDSDFNPQLKLTEMLDSDSDPD